MTEKINRTPTWRGVMPILIAAIENGKGPGSKGAIEELYKLADYVDNLTSNKA